MCFKACQAVFQSLSGYKELKCTTKLFTGHTLCGLLIQMQNISLQRSGMRRKEKFLSSPLLSLFLSHFFSFDGHLVGFIPVGKGFGNAFMILGLDQRKGRWVVKQDYS